MQVKPPNSGRSSEAARGLGTELIASIVVFLVALPLCIGVAVAVGVSPGRAFVSGIVGGLIVGAIAGSPLQVSGPAAGLFVIVAGIISENRSAYLEEASSGLSGDTLLTSGALDASATAYALAAMGFCVFLVGGMQIAAGQLRLGRWFRAVSPSVIQGMLAGIGALIVVSQFHVMLDHHPTWHGHAVHEGWQYLLTMPQAVLSCFSGDGPSHLAAGGIGMLTIITIVAWNHWRPAPLRILPGALIGVLLATLISTLGQLDVARLNFAPSAQNDITLPSTLWAGFVTDPSLWISAVVLAFVASADALLTAAATDTLARDVGVKTDFDRELRAQGVGNVLCGLAGALPITGVIVRSSANVEAGARTRLSTVLHGVWLLIFVCALPWVLNYIPISALGALLVYTGVKLLEPAEFRKLLKISRTEAAIYLTTVFMIVAVDLSVGVIVGFALSAAKLLYDFSHLSIQVTQDEQGKRHYLHLDGAVTFLRLPLLADELEKLPGDAELHVCLQEVSFIDHACFELLMEWAEAHLADDGKLVMDWDLLHGKFAAQVPRRTSATPAEEGSAGNDPNLAYVS